MHSLSDQGAAIAQTDRDDGAASHARRIAFAIWLAGALALAVATALGTVAKAQNNPPDPLALTRAGLAALGLAPTGVDPPPPTAIRAYQTLIGTLPTGVLTGAETNDLAALSPAFIGYPADAPALFGADLTDDLDREGLRQLATALARRGFAQSVPASPTPDQLRPAIAAYKTAHALPGPPTATRRLLAHLTGAPPPQAQGRTQVLALVAQGRHSGPPRTARAAPSSTPAALPAPEAITMAPLRPQPADPQPAHMPSAATGWSLRGVSLGTPPHETKAHLLANLDGAVIFDSADAQAFGGTGALSQAFLAVSANWPAVLSEQILVLSDATHPGLGARAIVRLIRLPDHIDQTRFAADIVPKLTAALGDGRFERDGARWLAHAGPNILAPTTCGALSVEVSPNADNAFAATWRGGEGPRLGPVISPETRACSHMLSLHLENTLLRIALWDSRALADLPQRPPQVPPQAVAAAKPP